MINEVFFIKIKKSTEKKIEILLDIAKAEMLEKGISNFSFDKVISSTSLSKATVYKIFINKDGFIKAVISSTLEDIIPPFKELLNKYKSLSDALNDLENINFDAKAWIEQYRIEDLMAHKEYTEFINNFYYKHFGHLIMNKIKEFQDDGDIRNDIEPIYIFEFITSVTKGMGIMLKDKDYKKVVNNYIKLIKSSLTNTREL